MRTITVLDRTTSGDAMNNAFDIEVPVPCTLRELIQLRVREEVARHNASHAPIYRGLVCPAAANSTEEGFRFANGWRRVDWEQQAHIALQAFRRNGFFVFLDDRQLDDLDALVELPATGQVQFIRLVHLVGG